LARLGYELTGVDPSAEMLAIARRGAHGDRVRWIHGGADRLDANVADLAIMSGHVAQFFVADAGWVDALRALRRAVRPGGRLAFESRNPDVREWERWTRAAAVTVHDPVAGPIEIWAEVDAVDGDVVSFTNHYQFLTTGDDVPSQAQLRFRSEAELRDSLGAAGFTVECVYGDWDRRPASASTRELIVVAG
jgi:SAM-dependent methyltransferase